MTALAAAVFFGHGTGGRQQVEEELGLLHGRKDEGWVGTRGFVAEFKLPIEAKTE